MKSFRTILIYAGLILLIFLLLNGTNMFGSQVKELQYADVLKLIESGEGETEVGLIVIKEQNINGWFKASRRDDVPENRVESEMDYYPSNPDFKASIPSYGVFVTDVSTIYANRYGIEVEKVTLTDYDFELMYYPPEGESIFLLLLPYLILLAGLVMFFFLMRSQAGGGRGAMPFAKSRPKVVTGGPKVTFDDVAGEDEEKEELQEIVQFMKAPERFVKMGARIPKGVLLVGPPGTGKTLLAKAVAGEAGVPFFSISGSDFVEMFVGVGASRVRDLFTTAKKSSPAVIFIDEIDAVGRHRGAGLGGGHDEREQTLNQLLVEMDGFAVNEGIIVIAATNRPDILDPALLRPGRFDRRITVNMPDVRGREDILKVHMKGKPIDADIKLNEIAQLTPGFTGADLENLLNEAAILAARRGKKEIGRAELQESITRVMMGPEKKSRVISPEDKRITAYHEAGHAVAAYKLKNCDPLREISIIQRGSAAGYTMTMPKDEYSHMSKQRLLDTIAMAMGGRAAEEVALDDICTGAYGDLKSATKIARSMVTKYGMSEKIGRVFLGGEDEEVFLGRDFGHQSGVSTELSSAVDAEVREILETEFERAKAILIECREGLDRVAAALIEHEYMTGEQFEIIFNGGEVDFETKEEKPEVKDVAGEDVPKEDGASESSSEE